MAVDELTSEESETVLAAGLSRLENPDLTGFWIHLDVDVLDPEFMPAVDTRTPGGLDIDGLVAVLGNLLASPRSVGLDVTVFDPDLDPEGRLAALLTDALVASFSHDSVRMR